MKNHLRKALVLVTALIIFASFTVVYVAADEPPPENSIKISSASMSVTKNKTVQMTATLVTVDGGSYRIQWSSSDTSVAKVDQNGLVTGCSIGRATIKAAVPELDISDSFVIYCVRNSNLLLNMLEKRQRLGYRYSYDDDYYYTDDKDCWQYAFGFTNIYDLVAPYILLEYDYIRVYFRYNNLDWMIQLWKGQYGLLFYGSEVGVYTKKMSDKEATVFTHFKCPEEENWLDIKMSLYHDKKNDGNYEFELERPYDKYWWCTGFKAGHLRDVEPADELRMTTTITMKDEEMAALFAQGLVDCGFIDCGNEQALIHDKFYVDGKDVHIIWQDISEAENTMAIKTTFGVLAASGVIGIVLLLFIVLGFMFLGGGFMALLLII